jgi:HPt (histidine-containing phosphotransfer) domain-containing protein
VTNARWPACPASAGSLRVSTPRAHSGVVHARAAHVNTGHARALLRHLPLTATPTVDAVRSQADAVSHRPGSNAPEGPAGQSVRTAPDAVPLQEDHVMRDDSAFNANAINDTSPIHSRLAAHPRLHRLAIKFVEQWPQRMAEMRSVYDAGDLAELARLAHGLKASGSSVGFDALLEPAEALDEAAKASDSAQAGRWLDLLGTLGRRLKAPVPMPPAMAATPSFAARR